MNAIDKNKAGLDISNEVAYGNKVCVSSLAYIVKSLRRDN